MNGIDKEPVQKIGAMSLSFALTQIAGFWILSDAGYYFLFPLFGLRPAYNAEPVAVGLYYAAWISVTLAVFWPLYRSWPTRESPVLTHVILIGLLGGIVLFAVHGLPALPRIYVD